MFKSIESNVGNLNRFGEVHSGIVKCYPIETLFEKRKELMNG